MFNEKEDTIMTKKIYSKPQVGCFKLEVNPILAGSVTGSIDGSSSISWGGTGDGSDAASKYYDSWVDYQPWEDELWDVPNN